MSLKLGTTDISGVPTTLINTVNNKLDASTYTSNPRTNAVYITQTYHNGATWYRLWSNDFYELGGVKTVSSDTFNAEVTFVFPSGYSSFTDTNYKLLTTHNSNKAYTSSTGNTNNNTTTLWAASTNRKSTTGFYFNRIVPGDGTNMSWYVCGYIS